MDLPALSAPLTRADFDFVVPPAQVAQEPMRERQGARLLYRSAAGAYEHSTVDKLAQFIPPGSLLIVNNTQVFASRLLGERPGGGKVELFLLSRPHGSPLARVQALGRPLRKLTPGMRLIFAAGVSAEIVAKDAEAGLLEVAFSCGENALLDWLSKWGYVPLPPYIQRSSPLPAGESADTTRYQTVYARHLGSVAAPTAGLHFSPELLAELERSGVTIAPLTLHVGAGTFMPVKCEQLAAHAMHEEQFFVSPATLNAILEAKKASRKIVVVGTTSLRCLETLFQLSEGVEAQMHALAGSWHKTRLFIYPRHRHDRYEAWSADMLLTNFHQPTSTLFMLICALLGYDAAKAMYEMVVGEGYRFFSYGDTSLLALR